MDAIHTTINKELCNEIFKSKKILAIVGIIVGIIIDLIPAASHVRIIAPKLCGSSKWSNITTILSLYISSTLAYS